MLSTDLAFEFIVAIAGYFVIYVIIVDMIIKHNKTFHPEQKNRTRLLEKAGN